MKWRKKKKTELKQKSISTLRKYVYSVGRKKHIFSPLLTENNHFYLHFIKTIKKNLYTQGNIKAIEDLKLSYLFV